MTEVRLTANIMYPSASSSNSLTLGISLFENFMFKHPLDVGHKFWNYYLRKFYVLFYFARKKIKIKQLSV